MGNPYNIKIQGFENLSDFVSNWSPLYTYPSEDKYNIHISNVLDSKESFIELFKWKNGTGDVIYEKKMKGVLEHWDKVEVLKELKREFSWELFEKEFEPQKSSTVWKLFLLHIMNPDEFPIFDQHVFRSYNFFKNGIIEEIPNSSKSKYVIYKTEYKDWFNNIQKENNVLPKKMDESFFSFGQMLKGLKNYPIQISK
tara:strand:- start:930 stop:1520 length:591 start_codon:yes stop_codon:yes gene_type:complete